MERQPHRVGITEEGWMDIADIIEAILISSLYGSYIPGSSHVRWE